MHSVSVQNVLMKDPFGKRLEQARVRKQMDRSEAAEALGMRYSTYASHENGSRGGRRHAEKYARFYKVRLNWLLTGKGSPTGDPIAEIVEGLPEEAQNYALSFLRHLADHQKKPDGE